MTIQLFLHTQHVRLVLVDGETTIGQRTWEDDNDLLEKFFPFLDELLTEHDVDIADITDVTLQCDVPRGYTTARIARTIVKTLRFACRA